MKLEYKDLRGRKHTSKTFKPTWYVAVDKQSYPLSENMVEKMTNIRHIGDCDFKGEIFIGELIDSDWFATEVVVFFGDLNYGL